MHLKSNTYSKQSTADAWFKWTPCLTTLCFCGLIIVTIPQSLFSSCMVRTAFLRLQISFTFICSPWPRLGLGFTFSLCLGLLTFSLGCCFSLGLAWLWSCFCLSLSLWAWCFLHSCVCPFGPLFSFWFPSTRLLLRLFISHSSSQNFPCGFWRKSRLTMSNIMDTNKDGKITQHTQNATLQNPTKAKHISKATAGCSEGCFWLPSPPSSSDFSWQALDMHAAPLNLKHIIWHEILAPWCQ